MLYGRMGLFFLLYAAAEIPYVALQVLVGLRTGSIWDLPWSFAFLAGILLIATTLGPWRARKKKLPKSAEGPGQVWSFFCA